MGKRKMPQVNGGSMSDISFLLLTFFLLTSSINTDQGIARKLPPPLPPNAPKPIIHERNVLKVLINFNDQLLVNGKPATIATLKNEAKDFFSNPDDNPGLSESTMKEIEGLGEVKVSKGVVSLQNDKGTSYDMYIRVQNELTAAVNELRDELAMQHFGMKFSNLRDEPKEAIQKAIPVAISEAEPKDYGGKK